VSVLAHTFFDETLEDVQQGKQSQSEIVKIGFPEVLIELDLLQLASPLATPLRHCKAQ
jgi:hypothetical protein